MTALRCRPADQERFFSSVPISRERREFLVGTSIPGLPERLAIRQGNVGIPDDFGAGGQNMTAPDPGATASRRPPTTPNPAQTGPECKLFMPPLPTPRRGQATFSTWMEASDAQLIDSPMRGSPRTAAPCGATQMGTAVAIAEA